MEGSRSTATAAGAVSSTPLLQRRLGALDGAALVVSNVIGGGIFFTPVFIAQILPNPLAILSVWLVGGLLSLAGAMVYAELAALRPRAGGEYVYIREAFGPLPAFLSGWTSFVAGFSGAIAAGALALATYLGRFLPFAADAEPWITVPLPLVPLQLSPQSLVALLVIAALAGMHSLGLGLGRLVQNTLTGGKLFALIAFVFVGFAFGHGSTAHFTSTATVSPTAWCLALVPVMFTYSGWNAATYVAEEVTVPETNVPRALLLGTVTVIAVYLGLNLVFLYAAAPSAIGALQGRLLDATAERLFGFAAAQMVGAFTVVSIAASLSAMMLAGPRVYYAMARDGAFLPAAARIHPRTRTPVIAILAQAAWSGVLVLAGSLGDLVNYTGFAVILFAGTAVASVFVLRRRQPDAERPFSSWGYPVAPAGFVLASAVIVLNELVSRPATAAAGALVIAAGAPIFLWQKRCRARRP